MAQQTAVDWFCPKCDSYVSAENVTFEETHQLCNTGVIIKETKHIAQTAVEILVQNLRIVLYHNQFRDILLQDFINQANEIMEQQIIMAYERGQKNGYDYRDGSNTLLVAEEYFKQTYENK